MVYFMSSLLLSMGPLHSKHRSSRQNNVNTQHRHVQKLAAGISAIVAGSVVIQLVPHLIKTPMYNSARSGHLHTMELLRGHAGHFYEQLGMSKHVFQKLLQDLNRYSGLKNRRLVSMAEQLAIFLRTCRSGNVSRDIRDEFQHSPDTISK